MLKSARAGHSVEQEETRELRATLFVQGQSPREVYPEFLRYPRDRSPGNNERARNNTLRTAFQKPASLTAAGCLDMFLEYRSALKDPTKETQLEPQPQTDPKHPTLPDSTLRQGAGSIILTW